MVKNCKQNIATAYFEQDKVIIEIDRKIENLTIYWILTITNGAWGGHCKLAMCNEPQDRVALNFDHNKQVPEELLDSKLRISGTFRSLQQANIVRKLGKFMFNLFHKYDANKKCMNMISCMCLSKEFIIKVIMSMKLVLTSKEWHVESLK